MPTSFLSADAGFPRLTNDIPMEERMNRVQQYLFMLLEQLRYALANLSEDNFNEADLKKLQEETVSGINSVVTDLEGNVSILQQTASSLTSQVSDIEGNVSTLQQTAAGLTTRVSDAEGNISTLQQTAAGLVTTVADLDGDISVVSQKADRIDWIVASGTSISDMTMTAEAIDLFAQGINIQGYVTFSSLETAGQSIINGDNIELKADAAGDSVSYLTYTSVNGNTFAQIHTKENPTGSTLDADKYAFVIETPRVVDGDFCAMKLISGDSMSLESGWLLYMQAQSQVVINNGLLATRIQANNVSYVSGDQNYPNDCYIFASDGIYYGGRRILAT